MCTVGRIITAMAGIHTVHLRAFAMFELPALGLTRFHIGIAIVALVVIGSLTLADFAKVGSVVIFGAGIVRTLFPRMVMVFQATHVLGLA